LRELLKELAIEIAMNWNCKQGEATTLRVREPLPSTTIRGFGFPTT